MRTPAPKKVRRRAGYAAKFPVLESVIIGKTERLRMLLDLSKSSLWYRRTGHLEWKLSECLLIKEEFAPELTIEELFYTVPPLRRKKMVERITEQEIEGGFNPQLYKGK